MNTFLTQRFNCPPLMNLHETHHFKSELNLLSVSHISYRSFRLLKIVVQTTGEFGSSSSKVYYIPKNKTHKGDAAHTPLQPHPFLRYPVTDTRPRPTTFHPHTFHILFYSLYVQTYSNLPTLL